MLPFFYHKDLNITHTSFNLTEETSKHCIQVLRMQEGNSIKLTNGKGLSVIVEIIAAHKKNTLVKIITHQQDQAPIQQNSIAISLIKNVSRLEWFLEKATELGIYEIVPLLCQRTERQIFKEERFQTIVISAMLQSQQTFMPIIQLPKKFNEIATSTLYEKKYIAHCIENEKVEFTAVLEKKESQIILIGPEGDFTTDEIDLALKNGYQPVSLGNTRLRTETAGIAAATLMQLV